MLRRLKMQRAARFLVTHIELETASIGYVDNALRAALHTSSAYAQRCLSEINHEAKHTMEIIKMLYSQSN